jgi:formate dehydrogenase major subunit
MRKERPENPYASSPDDRFPYVMSTYRLTEHHTSRAMSRMLPHLAELQPGFFCEIFSELASERGIENGGWVTVMTPRGIVEARALVTRRTRPLFIDGKMVHQVGAPYHWGLGAWSKETWPMTWWPSRRRNGERAIGGEHVGQTVCTQGRQ